MLIKDLADQNILIWGFGTEGKAVKAYLDKHHLGKNIYVYNDNDSLIVLKTKEDQYIVFNLQSQKDTEKVYESIAEKVN